MCIKTGAGGRRSETELQYPKHLLQGIKHAVVCAAELRVAPRRTHGSGTERSAFSHFTHFQASVLLKIRKGHF